MRIISGEYRRRKLLANPGLTTRPITDFVKESLFARIEDRLPGQRVADVFSGTGTIGLEALSRGAASVTFFERDPKAFELLRRNIEALKAEERCFCWNADIFRCSFRPKGKAAEFAPFDWMFFDPPFAMVEEIAPGSEFFRVLKQIARDGITSPEARLVLRAPVEAEFKIPQVWQLEHDWRFSRVRVFVYRKAGVPEQDTEDGLSSEAEADASDELVTQLVHPTPATDSEP